jgi:ABC-type transport system substrate-binding protein
MGREGAANYWFAADDNPNGIGTGRPFMDGYDALWTPQSDSTQESALLAKQVDQTGFADDSNLVRVGGDASKFHLMETGTAGWLNSRLWMSEKSPFKDDRLRHALHLGVDRKLLGEQMFPAGEGRRGFLAQGPVGWIIQRWALPQAELEKKPGYRTDQAGRAEDIAEAKKLWSAAGGPSSLDIVFAGVPAYIPQKALPEMKRQLREVFNVDGKDEVDPTGYTKLGQCFLNNARDGSEGTCMMSWGFDNGWIDLDDWVYPYFHTGGTKNSSLLSDSKLDEMLDKQRGEFDYEKRHQIGLDIQNYLLDSVWARIDYVAPVGRSLSWNYVRNDFTATWFGHNYFYANVWLDQSDAGWSGRPS